MEKLQASYARGVKLQEGVSVAFVGLPNAGKSSFFNSLLGEDRSIVSEYAGTTRDIVHERLVLRGEKNTVTLRLEDTAGLRLTENPIEKMGISRTLQSAQSADLVLFLVEPTTSLALAQKQWRLVGKVSGKCLGILTKADLFSQDELRAKTRELEELGIAPWICTSSVSGEGVTLAIEAIIAACETFTQRSKGEILLTRLDQLHAVRAATEHLQRAQNAQEIELFAADVRQALYSLGPLIGDTPTDDILTQIFSEFCIGK